MEISCKRCHQKYFIPDNQLQDRRIHFNCEKCDYRIIVDRRGEGWLEFRPFAGETFTARDVFEGIFLSFNLKNLFLAVSYIVLIGIVFLLAALTVRNGAEFFMSRPVMAGIFGLLLLSLLSFAWDTLLYLISKNVYHRIFHAGNIQFGSISPEISTDLKPLFVLSAGSLLLLGMLLLPVYLMESSNGLILEGLFHIIYFVLSAAVVFATVFRGIITAFIAFRSRTTGTTLKNLFHFIRVENILIPGYLVLVGATTTLFSLVIALIAGGAIALIGLFVAPALIGGTMAGAGPLDPGALIGTLAAATGDMRPGLFLLSISTGIIALFIMAYLVVLNQTLATAAVFIMEKNPGRSMSRTIIALFSLALFVFILAVGLALVP